MVDQHYIVTFDCSSVYPGLYAVIATTTLISAILFFKPPFGLRYRFD